MKVEIELPEFEGFEYTGEYRCPQQGEWYLHAVQNEPMNAKGDLRYPRHILRRKPQPRFVTKDDIGKRVGKGEFVRLLAVHEETDSAWVCPDDGKSPYTTWLSHLTITE